MSVRLCSLEFEPRSDADLTVRAFEDANHALCEAETGSLAESRASACRLADGYVDTMVDWLRTRGFAPGGPPARPAESALTNAADNAGL